MWFGITLAVIVGLLLIWAALVDMSTRRQGRRPRGAADMRQQIRSGRRDIWRRRLRGTKFAVLIPDDPKRPESAVYVDPDAGAPFGAPPSGRRKRS